jgi:hypothetical protein
MTPMITPTNTPAGTPTLIPITSATLLDLLDRCQTIDLRCKGTTNHCPMLLAAACSLGADASVLHALHQNWVQHYALPLTRTEATIRFQDIGVFQGQTHHFASIRAAILKEMQNGDNADVAHKLLRTFPPAPLTLAFHAIIRLAYALRTDHAGEIASGLAALICGYLPTGIETTRLAYCSSPAEGFRGLSSALNGRVFKGRMITEKLRAVLSDPLFLNHCPQLREPERQLAALRALALQLYAQTRNFTALHLITGLHAWHTLLIFEPALNQRALAQELWLSFCAAYTSIGAPALTGMHPSKKSAQSKQPTKLGRLPIFEMPDLETSWQVVIENALGSQNDHQIKLTHACFEEFQLTGEQDYLSVLIPQNES